MVGVLRVVGYIAGLVLALAVVLLGLELLAPGVGPAVTVETWRVPVAVPAMVLAALVYMVCSQAVRVLGDER